MTIDLDLLLNEDTGDLDLTNGDITLAADVRQAAMLELDKRANDWFEDITDGIDPEIIFRKSPNLQQIAAAMRPRLENLGITLTRFDVSLDANRELDVDWDGIPPTVSTVVIGGRS